MKEIGYCHECRFYKPRKSEGQMGFCGNPDVATNNYREVDSDKVLMRYGTLSVGLNYGCIHFEQRTDEIDNFEDNANY